MSIIPGRSMIVLSDNRLRPIGAFVSLNPSSMGHYFTHMLVTKEPILGRLKMLSVWQTVLRLVHWVWY